MPAAIVDIEGTRYAKTTDGLYIVHTYGAGGTACQVIRFNGLLYKIVGRNDSSTIDTATTAKLAKALDKSAKVGQPEPSSSALSSATNSAPYSVAPGNSPSPIDPKLKDVPVSALVERYLSLLDTIEQELKTSVPQSPSDAATQESLLKGVGDLRITASGKRTSAVDSAPSSAPAASSSAPAASSSAPAHSNSHKNNKKGKRR